MIPMAVLADIIDTWTGNGNRLLAFVRFPLFPLAVAAIAVMIFAKHRTAGAVIGILLVGALAAIPVYNPGAFNSISSLAGF